MNFRLSEFYHFKKFPVINKSDLQSKSIGIFYREFLKNDSLSLYSGTCLLKSLIVELDLNIFAPLNDYCITKEYKIYYLYI